MLQNVFLQLRKFFSVLHPVTQAIEKLKDVANFCFGEKK